MRSSILLVLVVALAALPSFADGGDLLWDDLLDIDSGRERANALVVKGKRLVAVGRSQGVDTGDDWHVRALDTKTGALLWEDVHDRGGPGASTSEEAMTVAQKGSRIFSAGQATDAVATGSAEDWLVRALDQKTGAFLWEDLVDHGGADVALRIAVSGNRVIVGGRADGVLGPTSGEDWLVRALDAKSGALLWQDAQDGASGADRVRAVVAKGRRVVAVGQLENAVSPTSLGDWVVRVLDAKTGALLWQDVYDGGLGDNPQAAALKGNRLYVVGSSTDAVALGSGNDWMVRAYDLRKGTLLWSQSWDRAMDGDQARGVSVKGRQLVVVGRSDDTLGGTGRDWVVRVQDAKTGVLQWDDVYDAAGLADQATHAAVSGKQLFVGGRAADAVHPGSDDDWLVRAYDLRGGALLWEDEVNPAAVDDRVNNQPSVPALVTAGGSVFAAGQVREAIGPMSRRDWLVRALDAK